MTPEVSDLILSGISMLVGGGVLQAYNKRVLENKQLNNQNGNGNGNSNGNGKLSLSDFITYCRASQGTCQAVVYKKLDDLSKTVEVFMIADAGFKAAITQQLDHLKEKK